MRREMERLNADGLWCLGAELSFLAMRHEVGADIAKDFGGLNAELSFLGMRGVVKR